MNRLMLVAVGLSALVALAILAMPALTSPVENGWSTDQIACGGIFARMRERRLDRRAARQARFAGSCAEEVYVAPGKVYVRGVGYRVGYGCN
jgi:hypothetical protein